MTENLPQVPGEDQPLEGEVLPVTSKELVSNDAKNRAVRTFFQQLAIDVLVAVVVFLGPVVASWQSVKDIQVQLLIFTLSKTIVATAIAYITRVFLDKSSLPTFKPPVITGSVVDPEATGNAEDGE